MAEMATTDCSKLVKTIAVNVSITGYKAFQTRLRIGTFLIRLGIYVIGANAQIKVEE